MALILEWFKVIKDEKFIGAVTDQSFARYSPKSGRIHICKAIDGQYIVVDGKYYRDEWMLPLDPNSYAEWEPATVVSISEKEYDILVNVPAGEPLVVGKLINTESADTHEKEPKEAEVATVEYVRARKLKQLSAECNAMIENGFDLVLDDGVTHHFSLTVQDQLNLLDLQRALNEGNDLVYHADGELTQFYSEEDARDILAGATKWKQYNLALYNSLKNWINSIEDISVIDAIDYDSEIPEEYCTAVFQTLTDNF